jgi:hypothetical protein
LSAALVLVGSISRGVMLETGVAGNSKLMAQDGSRLAPAVCGLGAGAAGPIILNPATGRIERKANPAPTDLLMGNPFVVDTSPSLVLSAP